MVSSGLGGFIYGVPFGMGIPIGADAIAHLDTVTKNRNRNKPRFYSSVVKHTGFLIRSNFVSQLHFVSCVTLSKLSNLSEVGL